MASGYKSGGTDLDSIFLAHAGSTASSTGYDVNGSDLNTRYHAYTTGTKASNTGFRSGGSDLANFFQNISEPLETLEWTTSPWGFSSDGGGGSAPPVGLIIDNDGDTQRNIGSGFTEYIDWLSTAPNGNGSGWEYYYSSFSGDSLDSAPTYQSWTTLGSDRVWSYNTNASGRACSFTVAIRKVGDGGGGVVKSISLSQVTGG